MADDKTRSRTLRQKWRLISLPNKLMVVATIVIAIASAVNLGVAVAMWNEMHIGGIDTRKSADAAKDSVDLARKNAHFDQRAWLTIILRLELTNTPSISHWALLTKSPIPGKLPHAM